MKLASALNVARSRGMSAVSANRIRELAGEFASPEAFFASPKGTVLAQWRRTHPAAKKDLGARFWRDFDEVRVLLAEPEAPAAKPPGGADPLDRTVTAADLRMVADTMELTGMGRITLRNMFLVLETVEDGRKEAATE